MEPLLPYRGTATRGRQSDHIHRTDQWAAVWQVEELLEEPCDLLLKAFREESGLGVAPQVPGEAAVAQAVGHAQVVAGSVEGQVALSHLVQGLQAWVKVP